MGKRTEQKENRRQQILLSSLELFVRRGFHKTTVRDIAENCKISVGLLFHYFPTKQDILKELFEMAQEGITYSMERMRDATAPMECFEEITKHILNAFQESPLAASIFMLANQALTSNWLEDTGDLIPSSKSVEVTALLIQKGQQDNSIKQGNPYSLALCYWGAIQGIAEGLVHYPQIPPPKAQWIIDILRS